MLIHNEVGTDAEFNELMVKELVHKYNSLEQQTMHRLRVFAVTCFIENYFPTTHVQ